MEVPFTRESLLDFPVTIRCGRLLIGARWSASDFTFSAGTGYLLARMGAGGGRRRVAAFMRLGRRGSKRRTSDRQKEYLEH